jgi:hypothetical protein
VFIVVLLWVSVPLEETAEGGARLAAGDEEVRAVTGGGTAEAKGLPGRRLSGVQGGASVAAKSAGGTP